MGNHLPIRITYSDGEAVLVDEFGRAMELTGEVLNDLEARGSGIVGVDTGRKTDAVVCDEKGEVVVGF